MGKKPPGELGKKITGLRLQQHYDGHALGVLQTYLELLPTKAKGWRSTYKIVKALPTKDEYDTLRREYCKKLRLSEIESNKYSTNREGFRKY